MTKNGTYDLLSIMKSKVSQIFLSVLFAAVLLLIVVVLGGPALASDLATVDEFPTLPKNKLAVNCESLKVDLLNIQSSFETRHDNTWKYFLHNAEVFSDWNSKLRVFEEQKVQFQKIFFAPLEQGVVTLSSASEEVFTYTDFLDHVSTYTTKVLKDCVPEEKRAEAQAIMDVFVEREYEHLSAAAGFITKMQMTLDGWIHLWGSVSGQEFLVPQDFFAPVEQTAGHWAEAGDLVRQNGAITLESWVAFSSLIAP